MKKVYLVLHVPDEVDPEDVVITMMADFQEMNKGNYEEWYPDMEVMENIFLRMVTEQQLMEELWERKP